MDADGTNVINLTKNEAARLGIRIGRPTGKRIVFVSNREENEDGSANWELYVMNADGTNVD